MPTVSNTKYKQTFFSYIFCYSWFQHSPFDIKPHDWRVSQNERHAMSDAMSAPNLKLTPNWPTEEKMTVSISHSIAGWSSERYEVLEKEAWHQAVGSLILYWECFVADFFLQLFLLILSSPWTHACFTVGETRTPQRLMNFHFILPNFQPYSLNFSIIYGNTWSYYLNQINGQ